MFEHACKLGHEGIVSKRKDSRYVSGRSPGWIKDTSNNNCYDTKGCRGLIV